MKITKTLAVATAALTLAAAPAPEAWNVDNNHTEVTFEVRHFFTPVTGKFDDFQVNLVFDAENPASSNVSAVIDVASIDTNNERRDNHLRTPDFFDAERFPRITFESRAVRQTAPNEFVATGDLTIKDVTRTVELPITLLGVKEVPAQMQQMIGAERVASFQAELTVDRRDFDVGTGSWAETAVVGPDVNIKLLVEANQ